ncbi:MAG TPA: (d)CMP kinase [Candidatus Sphingobacterium stercoripullorum]|uniref:Cytidylate kinase n=1 Tax=Candidatus Sphingobacterium stercoripullorum TaxID=2838759 RepID=A0A9D1W7S2_9SPHI|nr:(d)CMP kinase [Candidatus Sphingobacterium stercoripullorum]HLR49320.1 (d)CMP kinase [Candidatus Sphingobacterium stercoripullorum]
MSSTNTVIAIDGYSSCGKSTLAKALAKEIGFVFIDTGAMYRAVALYAIQNGINIDDLDTVNDLIKDVSIELRNRDGDVQVFLNGEDVTESIRSMEVSSIVSQVAAIKPVRDRLVEMQQELGRQKDVVMDGRDIGTVVFPNADFKFFMTADKEVRAQRRFKELQAKGLQVTFEEVMGNLLERDRIDTTRKESPLTMAHDAIVLDNSQMDQAQQLQFVLAKLKAKEV